MSNKSTANASALTKLQQAYWEAKLNLNNSLGTHDDDCWLSTDSDLDSRTKLLQEADKCYNDLMGVLLLYKRTLCTIMTAEENLGSALVEYGIGDRTQAGQLMILSGRAISQSANQRRRLKSNITELYHEVQTFQFNATVDVLQTVFKMENVRKSYRSGLMWMKNESLNLDPDVTKKMKRFRKVQEHIKNLKTRFDAAKLDTMQKIDLYLLSRCNLFSKTMVPYREIFCKMSMDYSKQTMAVVQSIPSCSFYTFETLKELNEYSAKPYLECHHSSKQKYRSKASVKRNLKVKAEPKSFYVQPKSTTKAKKSQSAKCTPTKKVRFKYPLESELSSEKSSTISDVLINLNDDENNLLNQTNLPLLEPILSNKKSSTISETLLINLNDEESNLSKQSEPNLNSVFGKYSEDLLSLQIDSNMFGDSIKTSDEKKDLDDELEKCFEELNCSHIDHTVSDDLQFWSLMESLSDSKGTSKEENPNIESPINPIKVQQEESVSKFEKLLIEFDPYNDNILNTLEAKVFREDC